LLRFCPQCGTSTDGRQANSATTVAASRRALVPPSTSAPTRAEPARDWPNAVPWLAKEGTQPVASGFYSSAPPQLINTVALSAARATPLQFATREPTPRETLPPAATAVVAGAANRRRDVRSVSCTACIRRECSSEDIVDWDNISKGRSSFRSRRTYAVGSSTEVAVPHSPGAPVIFVAARIRGKRSRLARCFATEGRT
jgi:hypothetical protein